MVQRSRRRLTAWRLWSRRYWRSWWKWSGSETLWLLCLRKTGSSQSSFLTFLICWFRPRPISQHHNHTLVSAIFLEHKLQHFPCRLRFESDIFKVFLHVNNSSLFTLVLILCSASVNGAYLWQFASLLVCFLDFTLTCAARYTVRVNVFFLECSDVNTLKLASVS